MSPWSITCVWLSMRPGRQVARPRSTTRAPAGTARPAPTSLMRSASTITTAFSIGAARLPSIRRPHRSTVTPAGAAAPAAWNGARRADIRMTIAARRIFMAAQYPLEARKRTTRPTAGAVTGAVCMRCGKRYRQGFDNPCPRCGPEGVLDIEIDLDVARRSINPRTLAARPRDQWRYRELLPLPAGARVAPLHVGWTPIEDAPRLARWAGLRGLRLKDESRNPTASFKDRASGAGVKPALVEGRKRCGLGSAGRLGAGVPDWVAVSVGDGCTIAGTWKGLQEMRALGFISRLPRMLGVQAAGARPLVDAFEQRRDLEPGPAQTLADSICVGHPRNWRKALRRSEERRV